eukprot:GFKZ01014072.1.p1 GENE.GFKZ01014072.1~~GFKZ01014072.1.p1  ORF type:complete len:111 (+),score=10.61 GFKZ01014072.1:300-632(+)
MQVKAFSEQIADLHARYQIVHLRDSLFIWVQASPSSATPASFPSLSLSHPSTQSTAAIATILPGKTSTTSNQVAMKLATRYKIPVFASVDLGVGGEVENAVVARLIAEIG